MFRITPSRRRICKPLIRKNYRSFSSMCIQNAITRKTIVKAMSNILYREIRAICSDKFSSLWRDKSLESLIALDFDQIIEEMNSKTPTLLTLLKNCLKTKTPRSNGKIMLAMTAGIIFKHRRSSCSLLQHAISLVLYAGHSAKQVHNFFNSIGHNILLLWIKFKNVATRIVFTDCLQQ